MLQYQKSADSIKQYQSIHKKAIEMLEIFQEANSKELLRMYNSLNDEVSSFFRITNFEGANYNSENLQRHLSFLYRYLDCDKKELCEQDIKDLVYKDLPDLLNNILLHTSTEGYNHFDEILKAETVPLLNEGHYDSAIRKSFIILTERLRLAFNIKEEKDGEDLVNMIFGKSNTIKLDLNEKEKQSTRNLISGFYLVFRNKYAHNNIKPNFPEARSIVEMANTIILDIEKWRTNSNTLR